MSDAEAYGPLPGDGVIARPMFEYNRDITVSAPPADVWPWIVQTGYRRAGWYAPEALDRRANRWVWRLEKESPYQPSPWAILPEYQHVSVVT